MAKSELLEGKTAKSEFVDTWQCQKHPQWPEEDLDKIVMPIQAQPPSFVGKFKRGLSLLDSRFSEGLKLTF